MDHDFSSPTEPELEEWNRRRGAGETQLRGHFRALLPAIQSARDVRSANENVLESHPEVVFAALAGRPLPTQATKTGLIGLLVRASLLQRKGVPLSARALVEAPQVPTDNFLDAMAMALVARDWDDLGPELQVIRQSTGVPESLGSASTRSYLMALPRVDQNWRQAPALTSDEVLELAAGFEFTADLAAGSAADESGDVSLQQ